MDQNDINAKISLSSLTIQHPSYAHAERTILDTIEYNETTHSPEPCSILVLGESGVGKSTLNKALIKKLPKPTEVQEGIDVVTKVPFFHSSLSTTATPAVMASDLLSSMGVGNASRYAADQRIRLALMKAETRAIFYDELHNLAGNLTPHKVSLARGWIRDLITSTRVMIIGFGTPNCEDIFLSEAQVQKRFPIILKLERFQFSLQSDSDFVLVIRCYEREIRKFPDCYRIIPHFNETFLIQMFATTGGSINGIASLYEQALWMTLKGDRIFNLKKFELAADKIQLSTSIVKNGFRTDQQVCLNMISNSEIERNQYRSLTC